MTVEPTTTRIGVDFRGKEILDSLPDELTILIIDHAISVITVVHSIAGKDTDMSNSM